MTGYCYICGEEIPDDEPYCEKCAEEVAQAIKDPDDNFYEHLEIGE